MLLLLLNLSIVDATYYEELSRLPGFFYSRRFGHHCSRCSHKTQPCVIIIKYSILLKYCNYVSVKDRNCNILCTCRPIKHRRDHQHAVKSQEMERSKYTILEDSITYIKQLEEKVGTQICMFDCALLIYYSVCVRARVVYV